MQPTLVEAVKRIREVYFAFPPANKSDIDSARERGVPEELLDLFGLCNGAFIGNGDDFGDPNGRRYRLIIPQLKDLRTVQSFGFIFDYSPLYEASAKWWQLLDYGDANWLAFAALSDSNSCIVDVFHETVGELHSHAIVANSITELLDRLIQHKGIYWFEKNFQPYGEI